jgi:ABC-type multidrug transport system permease subunit
VTEHDASLHPLWELTKARLREFWREKGAVFWVFGFPILMAIGLGLAFRNKPPDLPRIAVVGGETSREVAALVASKRVTAHRATQAEAERALATAKIDLVVEWHERAPSFHYDPMQQGGPIAKLIVSDELQRAAGRRDPLRVRERTTSAPGSRYIDFLLPGLIGLNLMGSSMWGVGYNLVLARKRRLLRRYAVTPMRRGHFLLSFFFSRCVFLAAELGALVLFGALVFDTHVRGSYVALTAIAFWGAASFAAVSLLIGSRVDNTEAANGWMNFVQLPMWLLSGAFFSYERFPAWLHGPIRALPLTALVDGLRAVFNDGVSFFACWPELAVMSAWGAVGFAISLRTFRWQ